VRRVLSAEAAAEGVTATASDLWGHCWQISLLTGQRKGSWARGEEVRGQVCTNMNSLGCGGYCQELLPAAVVRHGGEWRGGRSKNCSLMHAVGYFINMCQDLFLAMPASTFTFVWLKTEWWHSHCNFQMLACLLDIIFFSSHNYSLYLLSTF